MKKSYIIYSSRAQFNGLYSKGKLIFGDLKYQTTPQEREEQLSYLIQSMYKNPLIDIYLMSQQENVNDINYYKLSYYSNQKIAYFKKNKYLLNKYHLPIYFLKNSLLIQKFDMLFPNLNKQILYTNTLLRKLKISI